MRPPSLCLLSRARLPATAALCTVLAMPAFADSLLLSGSTYLRNEVRGVFTTPDGYVFDSDALFPQLSGFVILPGDTIEYDFKTGSFRVFGGQSPARVIETDAAYRAAGYTAERNAAATPVDLSSFSYPAGAALSGAPGFLIYVGPDYGLADTGPPPIGGGPVDSDGDGFSDTLDNCPGVANPSQADFDNDGLGDACDADDDNDGLSDAEELLLGTGATNPDSDNDGLTDGEEVNTYGTQPLVADSDGDGLSDGYEVLELGSNPLNENDPNQVQIPLLPLGLAPALIWMLTLIARRRNR